MLKAGIIGLPNVGKSTLFNALTNGKALAANYPFATIEPNVGIVSVQDERLLSLERIYQPKKVIPTAYQFTDIAGLVKGASKGEGLGNQFLSHIREVDAVCHIVRCFELKHVTHVDGSVDPIRDFETIDLELRLSDMEVLERRLERMGKKMKTNPKEAEFEVSMIKELLRRLDQGLSLKFEEDAENALIQSFQLLSTKPMLVVGNVSDDDLKHLNDQVHYQAIKAYVEKRGLDIIPISVQLESELAQLEKEDLDMMLEEFGLAHSGLDTLILKSYEKLGLKTFFTAGEQEVRAWTFKEGMKAPQCAGIIHTDFEKGFIRSETLAYDDLMQYKTPLKAKEAGRFRLEGKDYLMQDGDIVHFRFNV
jgi:ribosome-binding ATPase